MSVLELASALMHYRRLIIYIMYIHKSHSSTEGREIFGTIGDLTRDPCVTS